MSRLRRSRLRRWSGRLLPPAFLCLAGWLAYRQAGTVDWREVGRTLRDYRAATLAGAFALSAASYSIYGCFDVLGRRCVGVDLSDWRAATIGAVSYAFNLNIGSIVGGAGVRLRLYSRLGIEQGRIAALIAFSIATNWIGYLLVAGAVFALGGVQFPEGWNAGDGAMRAIGALMALASLGYVVLCRFSPRRELSFGARSFLLPPASMALRQVVAGASNWLAIAGVVFVLLPHGVSFATALAVVCVASIAGAAAHIPAGLGVIEGVFVAMLGGKPDAGTILAAVLAYRAVYYLVPLIVAALLFVVLEWLARHRPAPGRATRGHGACVPRSAAAGRAGSPEPDA